AHGPPRLPRRSGEGNDRRVPRSGAVMTGAPVNVPRVPLHVPRRVPRESLAGQGLSRVSRDFPYTCAPARENVWPDTAPTHARPRGRERDTRDTRDTCPRTQARRGLRVSRVRVPRLRTRNTRGTCSRAHALHPTACPEKRERREAR